MAKIQEIEQDQLSWLDLICDRIDVMVDLQKDSIRERMMQFQDEKQRLL